MDLKEIYHQWEDKWYDTLDKIDAKVPIYHVVDQIDTVVPSFAVFLAFIALVIVFFAALPFVLSPQSMVTIVVEDSEGNLLQGVEVDYAIAGIVNSAITNENGEIVVPVLMNSTLELRVNAIEIDGTAFEATEKTFFIENESSFLAKLILRETTPDFVDRTILFQNAAGEAITGKAIKVRLSCQNPLITPSPLEVVDLDMDGRITVREPKDCGIFQATIIEPAEFAQKSYILNRDTQEIRLEGKAVAKGSVRVRIKDISGNIIVSSNFTVKLLDSDGLKVNERYTQSYGEASFSDVTAGIYGVSIEDTAGQYGMAAQSGITVTADESTSVEVVVAKTVKATLNVSIVDRDTGTELVGAKARLVNANNETIAEKETSETESFLVFRLTDTGDYTIYASHPDYLYEIVELQEVSSQDIVIEMEALTEFNSGRVNVTVVDEDDEPVKNAKVKIRFLETGMLVPVEPKMTDNEGVAKFTGLKEDGYYAYIEKYPASGDNKSQGKVIDIREITEFTVKMIIGDAIVMVNAIDEDLQSVHEAEAEFFSERGESLGKIPLTDGTGQFELKADKKVYVVVEHANYMTVYTMPKQLWPGQNIQFDALMEPRMILGTPKIEFAGILGEGGTVVQALRAGSRYTVMFKVSVPEEGDYESGGVHFRVGDERLLINDPLVIKDAVVGNADAPAKSTSFTPPTGYDEDSENGTEGDAKWINIRWPDMSPGNYYLGFEIRVKTQITPYTRLPLHYRTWAIDGSGDYIRTPDDSELGISESVSGKQALYAKTLDLTFLEGQESECQEDFCYSGESILDKDKGLYIYAPYEMRAGSPHEFTFSILNNSERQYDNSELFITAEGLTISDYTIQNAGAQEITASNLAIKTIDGVNLGPFTKGKSISGAINFTPNTIGLGSIEVKAIADGRVVFLKTITSSIVSENEMRISLNPETVSSYVATPLIVTLHETELGFEVEEALVRVSVRNPDKTELFFSATTNGFGTTTINLPELEPRTVIRVEAEKPGYYAEAVESIVDSNVLKFNPAKITQTMETRGAREETIPVQITNTTGLEIEIQNVELSGRFKGLLDRTTMANFSKQFIGTRLLANSTESLQFFKIRLSENIQDLAFGNETLEGEFIVTATNTETGVTWNILVPIEVMIKVSGLPDNSPCLVITKHDWTTSTQGNRATLEFEVQNNCVTEGRATALESIQAQLIWNSDIMGNVELSLTDSDSGQSNTETLKPEQWAKIVANAREDSTFYGMLTFTPMSGFLGEDAQFSVDIDGAINIGTGTAFVGSNPNKINADIRIINLEQCIQYPGAEDIIDMSGDIANFSVDGSECGDISIEIDLCQNDIECRGGSVEGGITVTPLKFTLSESNPSQEVTISRQSIPGMYGIPIHAKTPGRTYRKVALLDVLITPDPNETFSLDKYVFTMIGAGSQDNATLTNKDLSEQVAVTASACDWGTAEEEGMFDLAGAGVGAAIGAFLGLQNATKATSAAAKAISLTRTNDLIAAENAMTTANTAVEAADTASETARLAAESAKTEAITAAAASTKAAMTTAGTISWPACQAMVQPTLAATNGKMAKVETSANGTWIAKVGKAILSVGNGIANAASGVANVGKAKETAAPNTSTQVGSEPLRSQADLDNAISDTGDAATDMTENGTQWGETLAESQAMTAELKIISGELDAAEGEMAGVQTCCTCPCGPTEGCCPCTAQATTTQTAITEAITSVNAAITATETASAEMTTAQTTAETAAGSLDTANQALTKAKSSMGSLGTTMTNAGKGAGFLGGMSMGTLATYAGLGALAGGLLGGLMGEDPCDQQFTATLTDYVINLKDDSQPIDVDHPSIAGFWSTDEAKVFGTYDSQEVGVYFENLGLDQTDAVYGVASFRATRHFHNNPTMISKGNSGFGPFNVPDQAADTYAQKIHLKFITAPSTTEVELLPQDTYGCLQGSLFGETGEQALPRTKLSWDWSDSTGIAIDSCDYDNEDGIYCDATQFSIAMSKKLRTLENFLEENEFLPCPTNPFMADLEEITAEFDAELAALGLDPLQLYYPGCWMPVSTIILDGTPALLYYVEEADESGGVNWTPEVSNIDELRQLTQFRARLAMDGYSSDFQNDFADFYTTKAFYDAPEWFTTRGEGKWADYFEDTDNLRFKQRFVENTSLPDAGIYDVVANIGFESGAWEFFDASGTPDAKAVIEFVYLDQAYPNSVFYYLPFNGNVGTDSTNGRNGYGLGYFNTKEPVAITTQPELVDTKEIYGSNPIAEAKVEIVSDFKTINSVASKRGFLLELGASDLATRKNIMFYPNYATPVIMKMSSEKTDNAFSAFYEAKDALTPIEAGTSLSFWTGAGSCLDFSGSPVYEAFRFRPDRSGNELDPLSNWQFAYATDWDGADYAGNVYLKTVFYSPISGSYKVKALQPSSLAFISPNSSYVQTVELQGIIGMNGNDGSANNIVSEFREIFDLVEDGVVCVTDTGEKTSFWWNPKALDETSGSVTSISAIESGLTSGSSCIGYGN